MKKPSLFTLPGFIGVFFLLDGCNSAENAHGSLMGIHLAEKAIDKGLISVIFLNVNRDELLQSDYETIEFHSENIIETLNSVETKRVEVVVCTHCMTSLGIDKKEVPSYKISDEEIMMEMLSSNPRAFSPIK